MTTTCPRCSHVNPADASYCHYDGASLANRAAGPVDMARQAFPMPFVFPSGRTCRNFDELAQACVQGWAEAGELLVKGYFKPFFSSVGRIDLAMAAEQAASFPDRDRGVDALVSRLPSVSVKPPRLRAVKPAIDLGTLKAGQDRSFQIELTNDGARLVFGSLAAAGNWLAPAAATADASRLVQFRQSLAAPMVVRGQHVRAGTKPLETDIVVETNAGTAVIHVTAQVPVVPFADGALAGARTPRDIAEKAKRAPKEAAALFESGAVFHWYQANGWTYPVQGPSATGVGAIQQFFEALGLTKPPRVQVGVATVRLRGSPGEVLHQQIRVFTTENRPIFAHGRSAEPAVVVKPAQLKGSEALVPIDVTVPDQPGKEVHATVQITANGNQRFEVDVAVMVQAAKATPPPSSPGKPTRPMSAPAPRTPAPTSTPAAFSPWKMVHLVPVVLLGIPLLGLVASDFVRDLKVVRKVEIVGDPVDNKGDDPGRVAVVKEPPKAKIIDEPDEVIIQPVKFKIDDEPEERVNKPLPVKVEIKDEPVDKAASIPTDAAPLVQYLIHKSLQTFGINTTKDAGSAKSKLLTYAPSYPSYGTTNSTVIRLDKSTSLVGDGGQWTRSNAAMLEDGIPATPNAISPSHSTWITGPGNTIVIHQVLEIVPGQVTSQGNTLRRQYDTVVIRWVMHNKDKKEHRLGLRLQLDTMIGQNDGVPFTVPGRPGLVTTSADFKTAKEVPDFIQALERPKLHDPGTVAHLTLKLGSGVEPPDRLSLTAWPETLRPDWEVPVIPMGKDSAVVLYWSDKALKAGAKRTIGFAYGLGNVVYSDKLGLTLGGSFEPGQRFTATAYVENPMAGQTVRIELPKGLKRVDGAETQPVPAAKEGNKSLVTWKVEVEETGTFKLAVHSSTGISQAKTVSIVRPEGPVTGKLALGITGSFERGQTFGVTAKLSEAPAGQTLTLQIPKGLEAVEGDLVQKAPMPNKDGEATVQWRVKVLEPGKYLVRVSSSGGISQAKTVTIAEQGAAATNFKLALDGDFAPGKVFKAIAHVTDPVPDQTLTLQLPPGLERVGATDAQPVPAGAKSIVAWQVKILKAGKFSLGVASSTGITQRKSLIVEPPAEKTGPFTFELIGEIRPGQSFDVVAKIADPAAGQTLTLTLPKELKLKDGEARQAVPSAADSTVSWRVQVISAGRLPVRIESSTGLVRTKTIVLTQDSTGTLFGQ